MSAGRLAIPKVMGAIVVVFSLGFSGAMHGATTRVAASAPRPSVSSDFNGDGYPDLAVGIPNGDGGLGAVMVLYGSPSGLTATGAQYWTLDSATTGHRGAAGDEFGFAVASGDFTGGHFADLAIGVPGKSAVVVLYGSRSGLDATGSQFLPAAGSFGASALAAGDFNRDGFADLAVGAPFTAAGKPGSGVVEVHYGSPSGLTAVAAGTAQRFSEARIGTPAPAPQVNDNFGASLAVGDFNGDGYADLAIGAPNSGGGNGGAVVLYGSAVGLTASGSQYLVSFGVRGSGGFALAAGDFNGDHVDDLAIGDPTTYTAAGDAGAIEVHYGSRAGLRKVASGTSQFFAEVTPHMPGPGTVGEDKFGFSLATGDFDGTGYADIAIGVPGQSAVVVLYGSSRGLSTRNAQFLPGVGPHSSGLFAPSVLAVDAGDFSNSGFSDLVVGEPFADAGQPASGVVEEHLGSASGVTSVQLGSAPEFSEATTGMPGPPAAPGDNFGLSLGGG